MKEISKTVVIPAKEVLDLIKIKVGAGSDWGVDYFTLEHFKFPGGTRKSIGDQEITVTLISKEGMNRRCAVEEELQESLTKTR